MLIPLKIISPIAIYLPRKTKKDRRIALNLNIWRNLHYIVSNHAKQAYRESMMDQLGGLVFSAPITLTFVLFKANKRQVDRANVLSIVEKCFCDALTYYKCIEDDNDEFIASTSYYSGGIDKDNPRAEVYIKEGGLSWEEIKNKGIKLYSSYTKEEAPKSSGGEHEPPMAVSPAAAKACFIKPDH